MHILEMNQQSKQTKRTQPGWQQISLALGIIFGGGSLLFITSGGFPPPPWRLLFEASTRFSELWQSQGGAIWLPFTVLLIHSLSVLTAWISLFLCAYAALFVFQTTVKQKTMTEQPAIVHAPEENEQIVVTQQQIPSTYASVTTTPMPVQYTAPDTPERIHLPEESPTEPAWDWNQETLAPPVSTTDQIFVDSPEVIEYSPLLDLSENELWDHRYDEDATQKLEHERTGPLMLHTAARSHPGQEKRYLLNEDRLFIQQWPKEYLSLPEPCGLFLIAECSGPSSSGLAANQQIIQTAIDTIMPALITSINAERLITQLLQGVQHALMTIQLNNEIQTDIGMSAVLVMGETIGCIHLGKTRSYLYQEDEDRLAVLASTGIFASGLIDDSPTSSTSSPLQMLSLQEGHTLLLCSDGLRDTVSEDEITYIMRNYGHKPAQAVNQLLVRALQRGGPDNISAIIINATHTRTQERDTDIFNETLDDIFASNERAFNSDTLETSRKDG